MLRVVSPALDHKVIQTHWLRGRLLLRHVWKRSLCQSPVFPLDCSRESRRHDASSAIRNGPRVDETGIGVVTTKLRREENMSPIEAVARF